MCQPLITLLVTSITTCFNTINTFKSFKPVNYICENEMVEGSTTALPNPTEFLSHTAVIFLDKYFVYQKPHLFKFQGAFFLPNYRAISGDRKCSFMILLTQPNWYICIRIKGTLPTHASLSWICIRITTDLKVSVNLEPMLFRCIYVFICMYLSVWCRG